MKTILVCEDDDGILDVVSIVLEEAGYETVTRSDTHAIDEAIVHHHPSLILMDLWIPGEGGEAVTKRLKQSPKTNAIPIVIISANKDTERIAREAGANGFLAKPFDIDTLVETVNQFAV